MISEESFKLFSYIIRVGHWTKILPFKWNPVNYKVEVVPNLNRWRMIAVANLTLQWVMVWSAFAGLMEPGAELADWILFAVIALGEVLATMIQIYNFVYTTELSALLSSIHLFVRKLVIYHGMNMSEKD